MPGRSVPFVMAESLQRAARRRYSRRTCFNPKFVPTSTRTVDQRLSDQHHAQDRHRRTLRRDGYTVHYARAPRLFADLDLAHGDGRFARLFRMLVKFDPLVLDDSGPDRLSPASGAISWRSV